jgi:hypothetical protein
VDETFSVEGGGIDGNSNDTFTDGFQHSFSIIWFDLSVRSNHDLATFFLFLVAGRSHFLTLIILLSVLCVPFGGFFAVWV